ncbi:MAG: PLP-dependent aminotransferase family protein [Gemmatimonadaceae bacterium]
MPRTRRAAAAPAIALPLRPDRAESPLYVQLYQQLREHIVSGLLSEGRSLPSARTMARDLRVSRNTVDTALGLLAADGFVTRRVGAGTVVSALDRIAALAWPARSTSAAAPTAPPSLSARGALLARCGDAERDADGRGLPSTVDVAAFPVAEWNRVLARSMRERGIRGLQAADPQGDRALRRAISEHVRLARGVRCTAEQVLITSSTQQALDLIGRLLIDTGDRVLMEDPGYPSARMSLEAAGATLVFLPVDRHGVDTDRLATERTARLLYVTPSHQFPLGVTLSLKRRMAALAWATARQSWIVEDDYDSEFRYDGRPIAALQGIDRAGRVLYIGSFNKVLFPGLRVAYLILPPALVESFVSARRLTDGGSASFTQAALAAFVRSGRFAAYLRRMRGVYAARRDALVTRLEALAPRLRVGASDTGLHLVAHLPSMADDLALAAAASGFGLGVAPLSNYYASRERRRGLLMTFGATSPMEIAASIDALAAMLRTALTRASSP